MKGNEGIHLRHEVGLYGTYKRSKGMGEEGRGRINKQKKNQ